MITEAKIGEMKPESPGMLRAAKRRKSQGTQSPLEPLEGVQPSDILILDFWSQEL